MSQNSENNSQNPDTSLSLIEVDFSRQALAIGVEFDGNKPWMELSKDELLVLARLLKKPLCADGESAASFYPMLKLMAEWAEAAAAFASDRERQAQPLV